MRVRACVVWPRFANKLVQASHRMGKLAWIQSPTINGMHGQHSQQSWLCLFSHAMVMASSGDVGNPKKGLLPQWISKAREAREFCSLRAISSGKAKGRTKHVRCHRRSRRVLDAILLVTEEAHYISQSCLFGLAQSALSPILELAGDWPSLPLATVGTATLWRPFIWLWLFGDN